MIRYSRPKLSEAWSQVWETTNLPPGGLSRSFSFVWKQQQTDPNAYGGEKTKYFYIKHRIIRRYLRLLNF